MLEYTLERTISVFGDNKGYEKRLTLLSWKAGEPAKLDLRIWKPVGDGHKPGKGMTLTDIEAKALNEALTAYLMSKE